MTNLQTSIDEALAQLRATRVQIKQTTRALGLAKGVLPPDDLTAATRTMSEKQPNAPGGKDADVIALLLRDVLDAAVPAFVARLGPYECGPALSERPIIIPRLERELSELCATEERMVDDLQASGLSGGDFEHRRDVQQRRAAEQQRREQQERQVADRAKREAAIDQKFTAELAEAKGHGRPSQYLQQQSVSPDRADLEDAARPRSR